MKDILQKIPLHTDDGDFVCHVYVPKFLTIPDVILWGVRTFTLRPVSGEYREGFAYMVPPGMDDLEEPPAGVAGAAG